MYTLNCGGKLIVLHEPVVMGIINVTPDSFYKDSRTENIDAIVALTKQMLFDGATFIDIGGQSTRPGSERLSADEEAAKILPPIEAIIKALPRTLISIDTYHAAVARQAIEAGACIVNDVGGGWFDANMLETVAKYKVPYICMHNNKSLQHMHDKPFYKNITLEIIDYFIERIEACKAAGILDVIIDPGFGFYKKSMDNFRLLKNLQQLKILQKPMLAGLSRKSTIYKTLDIPPEEALNGSTVLHTLALQNGADIIRTHDVKAGKEAIILLNNYKLSD
ncbi:MAG: dihydropteroate synthase [Ginsengibacter sp.]